MTNKVSPLAIAFNNRKGALELEQMFQNLLSGEFQHICLDAENSSNVDVKIMSHGGLKTSNNTQQNIDEETLRKSFNDCINSLDKNKCCILLYDFMYVRKNAVKQAKMNEKKMIIIKYVPSSINVRHKAILTQVYVELSKCLYFNYKFEFSGDDEINYDLILNKLTHY